MSKTVMEIDDKKDMEASDEERYKYGWFSWTPRCGQVLLGAKWLLLFMSIANIFQSMTINGLPGTILTSLETRFGLSSSQSSWIVSAYDVSTIPMLVILSYFGSSAHRVKWTAVGIFILVVGNIIFILPHVTTGVYEVGSGTGNDLCREKNETEGLCYDANKDNMSGYLALFILARVFHGIGGVPLYTICVTFLDDVVSKETFSLYIGKSYIYLS